MNRMKKFMALFLAVVLIAQTGFAASAEESTSPVEPVVQNETLTEDAGPQEETDAADLTGQQPENSEDTTSEGTSETEQGKEDAEEVTEQPEDPTEKTDGEQPGTPSEVEESKDEGTTPSGEQSGEIPSGETGSREEGKEPAGEVTEPVEEEQGEEKQPVAENALKLMSELDGTEEELFTVNEEEKTVQIDDAEGLRAWADSVRESNNRYDGYTIEITANIDLGEENWTSIISLGGTVTIDGQGHTISNMKISEQENGSGGNTYLGFIGNLNYNTKLTVQNITFENAHVQDLGGDNEYSWCGVVVGHGPMDGVNESQAECTFTNVHIVNSVVTGGHNNGGILGYSCSTETGIVFENCSVTDSFIGGYDSTSGILFGMGIANVTVKDCSANGVRLYSDGLNFNCTQSHVEKKNQLWLGNVYPEEIYGDSYGSNGTATYDGTNTATDSYVVYPVVFHIGNESIPKYVPVNTDLRSFDDVWFGDKFEAASGKTIQWYDGTGADAKAVTQIIASLEDTDMYPYGKQSVENTMAYETQDTGKVANPVTHGAIDLYAKDITTIPTDPEAPDWETSKSKTATNLDSNYESQVTLSLPSAEEKLVSDVVFVLDESSAFNAVVKEMDDMLESLVKRVNETNAEVKAGFVVFRGNAVTRPLEKLTSESIENINAFIQDRPETGGSNMLAGLMAAKEMLEADTSVANSRKYVILISDGITYTWTGENGVQMGVNFANADAPTTPMLASPDAWDVKYENKFVPSDWDKHFADISGLIGTTIKEKSSVYERNTDISEKPFIPYSGKDDYVSTVDIALYKCAELYKELQNEFHCYAVMRSAPTEKNPNLTDGDTYPYGPSFMNYLANGKTVDFDSIENDIYYLLDSGSRIEDYMGYAAGENGYNFDFINDASKLSMKVGDQSYSAVSLGENKYGFAENENGTYDYVLTYVEGNKQDAEHFVWNIYVPVSNFAPVQLIYSVKLVNPQKAEGTYGKYDANGTQGYDGLYTNNSATLYPVDSNGMKGDAEEFNKPTVSYTVSDTPATINITKKVQNSSGAAANVNATFYAAVFTDPQFTNRFGDVVELKLNGTSQVTVSVAVEAPADGSSRSYYVTETDKNGNVISGGESFGYQIGIEGSMVTVSESAPAGSVTITNKQIASSGNQGGGSTGGGSSSGSSSSGSHTTVASAKTGDETNILLPIAVIIVAAAALVVCVTVYRRKRS